MKVKHAFIWLLLIAGLFYGHKALAKDKVSWAYNDLIPFYIAEEPFKGQGISDRLISFFQSNLPAYEHEMDYMNFSRFYALAKQGDLVCNPLLLKTPEREEFLTFSKSFKPNYAHVLVSSLKIDYPSEGLSLKEYVSRGEGRKLFVQKRRSYGPDLDKILKEGVEKGTVEIADFTTKQLFLMLENGRIDTFLDIENSVTYYAMAQAPSKPVFRIPLKEDSLDRFGYVVCAKTPAGEELITQINKVLDAKAASEEFRTILEAWMAPENIDRFRRFYTTEILSR